MRMTFWFCGISHESSGVSDRKDDTTECVIERGTGSDASEVFKRPLPVSEMPRGYSSSRSVQKKILLKIDPGRRETEVIVASGNVRTGETKLR